MAESTIINNNGEKTNIAIGTRTSRFNITVSFGYIQNNNHFHVEVEGNMSSDLTNASAVPLFTFTNIPNVDNRIIAGTFILNGTTYPCRAKVASDGVYQSATGTLAAGANIGFILDFMV